VKATSVSVHLQIFLFAFKIPNSSFPYLIESALCKSPVLFRIKVLVIYGCHSLGQGINIDVVAM